MIVMGAGIAGLVEVYAPSKVFPRKILVVEGDATIGSLKKGSFSNVGSTLPIANTEELNLIDCPG